MTISKKSEKDALQALQILTDIIKTYNEVYEEVIHQKPLATLDYDSLDEELNANMLKAIKLKDKLIEKKIEFQHVNNLLQSLIDASQVLARIIQGLGDKAKHRAKYGWLSYRGDLKALDRKRQVVSENLRLFTDTIEYESPEDTFVTAKAMIIDPLANQPFEGEIEILKSHYNEAKDDNGYVYVMRSYEEGEMREITLQRQMWEEIAPTFTITEDQMKNEADQILNNILKKN